MTRGSSPGKVLIAGGYLVLDKIYSGLVFSTSSRFYSEISALNSPNENCILVESPQFIDGKWEYQVSFSKGTLKLEAISDQKSNFYLETVLNVTLSLIEYIDSELFRRIIKQGLGITLNADNDFYSQRAQLEKRGMEYNQNNLTKLPKFCSTDSTISNVAKTGLGSSAAMMTSLVGCLLYHFKVADVNQELIHNLTQFIHCLAQGKIGSGFDVSAAVYGSQIYQRFSPSVLHEILNSTIRSPKMIFDIVKNTELWDQCATLFSLPPGIDFILVDVNSGSNTPSMVSKVLKYKSDHPERGFLNLKKATQIFNDLNSFNTRIISLFKELVLISEKDPENYHQTLKKSSSLSIKSLKSEFANDCVVDALLEIYSLFSNITSTFKILSKLAQVPIYPEELVQLLECCSNTPGVIAAGLPGAGGYDAIFCLVLDRENTAATLEKSWSHINNLQIGQLLAKSSNIGFLIDE